MSMQTFTAERSLYRASGYYASGFGVAAHEYVAVAQNLPPCGTFTNCTAAPPSVCDTQCAHRCINAAGVIVQECCPAGQCGGGTGGCCKTVCCNVTVS
jgi:hypothetical protein